ncbi:galactokinase [Balneolales bacterium ANBcel1]|nr:galactokinase [Balneolales bacterium ANBcel1]
MQTLTDTIKKIFLEQFDGEPLVICSPGRVNLIGEHTDYNNGFVLPAAIDKAIYLAMRPNNSGVIRLRSVDMQPDSIDVPVSGKYLKTEVAWANYIIGVVDELQKAGYRPSADSNGTNDGTETGQADPESLIGGFDCVFGGDIPIGAGLSSSAALEGGVAYGLSVLFGLGLSRREMAQISQRAENHFVGVQCGIMDQFASLHGKADQVIKLDCRSLEYERYPFAWNDIRVLLCDTNVRRELAGSEYNIRRQQCEEGVSIIRKSDPGVESLRDVTFEQLEDHRAKMDKMVYRRCRYILEENKRVLEACDDLLREDLPAFGEKMYRSHFGLRNDYEVSCRELDILVEATAGLEGVLGARMMGGGFGGCTINLVKLEQLEHIQEQIGAFYRGRTGADPDFYVAQIGEGTHAVNEISLVPGTGR